MRKCTRCEIEKEEIEYEVRKNRKTGFNGVCKQCVNDRRKEAKQKNPDVYKKTAKKSYLKHREERIRKNGIWQKENAEKVNELHRDWYAKNKDELIEKRRERTTYEQKKKWNENQKSLEDYARKHRAHCLLNKYIGQGKIIKPERCQICDSKRKIEGHHHDYDKPLEVIWVCRACHAAIHRRLKEEP